MRGEREREKKNRNLNQNQNIVSHILNGWEILNGMEYNIRILKKIKNKIKKKHYTAYLFSQC